MDYFEILETASLAIDLILGASAVIICTILMRLSLMYEKQKRTEKIERTIKALQIPDNVSKAISLALQTYNAKGNLTEYDIYSGAIFPALDFFENLATGIHEEIYDERISYNRLGRTLIHFYSAIAITLYRSRGEGLSPSLYVELERLVRNWKDLSENFSNREK